MGSTFSQITVTVSVIIPLLMRPGLTILAQCGKCCYKDKEGIERHQGEARRPHASLWGEYLIYKIYKYLNKSCLFWR